MNIWIDWPALNKILEQKKRVYLFGRSEDWIPKTLPKIKNNKIEKIILDNNPSYKNTSFFNCQIKDPSILKNFDFNLDYVVITAEPDSIITELEKYKLKAEKNFCCTPEIKDWGRLQEIKNNSTDILFSSSDYFNLSRARSSKFGGGIFVANVADQKYEKKIDGQYRQMIKKDNYYYVIEYVNKEVHIFDNKFKIIQKNKLDQSKEQNEKPNYCGITYVHKKKCFYVANSASDEISIYEQDNFRLIDKIIFSNKSKQLDDGQCHINDLTTLNSNLLVSYFSRSGLWRKGIFDGGVSEIETDNNKINDLISNLSQPHSPEVIDGQIFVLDSFNKSLYLGTKKISKFPGFTRGLSFDGRYFYIGQSEDMYLSKDMGLDMHNTMCNAGIYQLDKDKNISRFLSTPDVMNIHDILVYE
tara:strand:- start:2980 stop:4221 length:1242 start_codon:yes stop_codon:yes gene_type:complete